jgi:hypothetical protein
MNTQVIIVVVIVAVVVAVVVVVSLCQGLGMFARRASGGREERGELLAISQPPLVRPRASDDDSHEPGARPHHRASLSLTHKDGLGRRRRGRRPPGS